MNCPRCGQGIQAGWVACPKCGTPVGVPSPQMTGAPVSIPVPMPIDQAYSAQRRKSRRLGWTIFALMLGALAIVAVTQGLRSLGFGSKSDDGRFLGLSTHTGAPVLGLAGGPVQPVMDQQVTPPATMPRDVFDWLEHLRKTEEARVSLTTTQLGKALTEYGKAQAFGGVDSIKDLLNGIDDPNEEMKSPTDELYPVLKELHDQSGDLIDTFESKQPPAECQPIHDAYYQALSETTGMLGDIADHLKAGDVTKLLEMQGTSQSSIDSNANKADRLVGEICQKYNVRRWFSIQGDVGSGGMLGMPKL